MAALTFRNSFVVKAPIERVWAYLNDPYRVAPALPGAAVTEKLDDGGYGGTITIKVGPVAAKYRGKLRFDAVDVAQRTATIVATGQDTSGRGGADMRMQSRLVERAPGETEVSVTSEVNVTGIMAQFGRGLIQDVSNQMFQRFTDAVRAELEKPDAAAPAPPAGAAPAPPAPAVPAVEAPKPVEPQATVAAPAAPAPPTAPVAAPTAPTAAPPIEVLSFGGGVLLRAAGRMARRPQFWIVVAAAISIVVWWCLR